MLVKCPECNHKLSTTADACPKCGHHPSPEQILGLVKTQETAQAIAVIIVWIGFGVAWFQVHSWITGLIFWGPPALVVAAIILSSFQKPAQPIKAAGPRPSRQLPPTPHTSSESPPQRPTLGLILAKTESGEALSEEESALILPIVSGAKHSRRALQPRQQAFLRGVERSIDKKHAALISLTDIETEFHDARCARRRRRNYAIGLTLAGLAVGGFVFWGHPSTEPTSEGRAVFNAQPRTIVSNSVGSMIIRGKKIYVGQLADDVFAFVTEDDKLSQEIVPDPRDPTSLKVTKKYNVAGQQFKLEFRRTYSDGPYRVAAIETSESSGPDLANDSQDVLTPRYSGSNENSYTSGSVNSNVSDPVDCYALAKYAEAQGHGWMEKSLIVGDAEKRGACKW